MFGANSFKRPTRDGYGTGHGEGEGDGYGTGYGDGEGGGEFYGQYGTGHGDGNGDGNGYGDGYGDGVGRGNGSSGDNDRWTIGMAARGMMDVGCPKNSLADWLEAVGRELELDLEENDNVSTLDRAVIRAQLDAWLE